MNITDIMQRDILDANREAAERRQKDELARQIARRERLAKIVTDAIWAAVVIALLLATFVAGHVYGVREYINRQTEGAESK